MHFHFTTCLGLIHYLQVFDAKHPRVMWRSFCKEQVVRRAVFIILSSHTGTSKRVLVLVEEEEVTVGGDLKP